MPVQHFDVKFTHVQRLTLLFNGRPTRSRQCLLWMFLGSVLILHRMRRRRRRRHSESVVPFSEGQWKETLVNSDGSPTEACSV